MTGRPPSPGPGDPVERRLVGLGRDIERTRREVGELGQLVHRLLADIDAISRRSQAGSPGPGEGPDRAMVGVRSWLMVEERERAETDLVDLVEWLDRIYLAYPGVTLTSCWLWHPTVVEELWWLRCAHADAYQPTTGSWIRVGDWHDRQRPNVVERVRQATSACEASQHIAGGQRAVAQLRAPLRSAVPTMAAWAAAGRPHPAPEPDADELKQAERYLRARYEGRR